MGRLFGMRGPREWAGANAQTNERAEPQPLVHRTATIRALTDAAGRGHAPPTPDPDPRDPGTHSACALRLSELVSNIRVGRKFSPGSPMPPGRA